MTSELVLKELVCWYIFATFNNDDATTEISISAMIFYKTNNYIKRNQVICFMDLFKSELPKEHGLLSDTPPVSFIVIKNEILSSRMIKKRTRSASNLVINMTLPTNDCV